MGNATTPMPLAQTHGIELCYESFGAPDAPLILLIMGFSAQMTGWDEGFCAMIARRGYRVVRFDNRDVGLSTKPAPSVRYTLEDMALDTVGLLDALGVESAHVVGASMGGMIAQILAIRHRSRVRSLASIMSNTGRPGVGYPRPEAFAALSSPSPTGREAYIDDMVARLRVLGSPGFPFEEAKVRERTGKAYDRNFFPVGSARQFGAVMKARDRSEDLARLDVPTVVIHGADDPLIQLEAGEDTARTIPGAKLVVIPGMGHDFPQGAWPVMVDAIIENARRADDGGGGARGGGARDGGGGGAAA
jgi:pimeloyl-ACP methyl ester carboxylesterase